MSGLSLSNRLELRKKLSLFVENFYVPFPPPPTLFQVGVNLSGAENTFPGFASAATINYFNTKKLKLLRIPFCWSKANDQAPFTGLVGIQPTVFGALDTTFGGYSYTPFGNNILQNSEAIASSPWVTFQNNSGTITVTNNAGIAPDSSNTATLAVINRSDGSSYAQFNQPFTGTATSYTGSIYLKAYTAGDVGKVISITLFNGTSTVGILPVVLTNSWVRYSTTATLIAGACQFIAGYNSGDSASTVTASFLAWGGMVNIGASADTYQATIGGYLAALDTIIQNAVVTGSKVILDNHMFGIGPGGFNVGSTQVPSTALADLWGKIAAYYVSQPALLAGIDGFDLMNEWPNGFDSSVIFTASQEAITAIRAAGYVGKIYVEGTNYTGSWNWVSGEGQPFNNSNLYTLVDPLSNLTFETHMYPDPDNAGDVFAWATAISQPGEAPPGLTVNTDIGVQRMGLEYVPWAVAHDVRSLVGEYGSSNDTPTQGGVFDYADWNTTLSNLLTYLQTYNIPITLWAAGPGFSAGFNGYAYSLDAFSSSLNGQSDYTSAGIQAPAMVILDEFTGYSGAQPQAYVLFPPGWPTPASYCSIGVATGNFIIYYGGKITTPVTITLHDFLADGTTPAGGTFTPSTITLGVGSNALANFTYTASQAATLLIQTTNSAGWIDPSSIGISSIIDGYVGLPILPTNIYGLYNRFTPNRGPALRLQRAADGQQMDWYLTLPNSAGYGGFNRTAIQTWASARSGIIVVTRYDMSGSGNHMTFSGSTLPTLNLQNTAGYPEIDYAAGCEGIFNSPINGQTEFYTIARMNQNSASVGGLYRMDFFVGPIIFGPTGFQIYSTGQPPPTSPPAQGSINTTLAFGIVDGQYHDYGVSYASGITSGFVTYKDSVQQATATITYEFGANFQTQVNFAYFKFGTAYFIGSDYNMEIGYLALTAAQMDNIMSIDATYYSTALPDTLPAINPLIIGTGPNNLYTVSGVMNPFLGVVVQDQNSGTPTDSATITLTGASATLTGSGLSGSGPYTLAAASAATISSQLQGLILHSTASLASIITLTLAIISSAGTTSTDSKTVITISNYGTTTAFSVPVGTFTPVNFKGVNMSGGENYPTPAFPSLTQIAYFASKGMGLIRMPINQATVLQNAVAYGPLNTTYLAAMKTVIDYCFSQNMYVIIDFHEAGGYPYGTVITANNGSGVVGVSTGANDSLADTWSRISSAFINYPNVIFGLMNEPINMTAAQWFAGVQNTITAIRATGCTQLLTVPGGGNNTGAWSWASSGNATAATAWLATTPDPLNNFWFEMHEYLDSDKSGTHPVATQNGSIILDNPTNGLATTWARANGVKVLLGEGGFAPDPWRPQVSNAMGYDGSQPTEVTNGIIQGGNMWAFMTSNSDVWTGWSYWSAGDFSSQPTTGGYAYSVTYNGGDQPQMAVLVANI